MFRSGDRLEKSSPYLKDKMCTPLVQSEENQRSAESREALLLNVPYEVVHNPNFLLLHAIDLLRLPDLNPLDQGSDDLRR